MDLVTQLGITEDTGRPITADEIAALAPKIAPVDGTGHLTPDTTGRAFTLPFYDGVDLLLLRNPAWQPATIRVAYLARGDRLYRLNGDAQAIHGLNETDAPQIDAGSALAYLRFFCFFVHGADGPFLISEDAGNPLLPQANRAAGIDAHIVPAELLGRDPRGRWIAAAVVHYDRALFAARFRITAAGMVEMAEDAPLIDDLPASIEAPLSFEIEDEIPY